MTKLQEVVGVREAALLLGHTLKHVYVQLYENKLAGAEKRGGRWVIPIRTIEARLRARKNKRSTVNPVVGELEKRHAESPPAARA